MVPGPTSRVWRFPYFTTKTDQEFKDTLEDLLGQGILKKYVFQRERCPTTGKEHLQSFVRFSKPHKWTSVQTMLDIGEAHLDTCERSDEANYRYCTKAETRIGTPEMGGDWDDQQGSRSDLKRVKRDLDDGKTVIEIAKGDVNGFGVFLKYHAGLTMYANALKERRTNQVMDVKLWYGATGTGKTRGVYKLFRPEEVYVVTRPTNGSLYYDGYEGQKCILFDDFYGWAPLSHMLNLLDRYQMKLKIHGGFVDLLASTTTIIITSNYEFNRLYEWDKFNEEIRKAFKRRISETKQFIRLEDHQ